MRSLIIVALVLSLASPVFATQRQGLFNRNRQQQNAHQAQQVRVVNRQRVRTVHHQGNAQQVQAVYVPVQRVFVPAQQLNTGHCNGAVNNAGVLQLNSGCSALYR